MSSLFQEAVREQIQLRAAIDGPTGSGKTWTSLQWARILAGENGRVALLDTENRSSLRYAPAPGEKIERINWWDPPYTFLRRDERAPYNPVRLGEFIHAGGRELGPDGVLVIDSLTHFWTGEGGTLDVADQARLRGASQFSAWQEATPVQRYLLEAMVNCPCHLIVTMRSKMSYEVQQYIDEKGAKRTTIERMGMQPEQRPGIEYEFDLVASMDQANRLQITKSRIPGLMGLVVHAGRSHEVALQLVEWLQSGVPRISAEQVATFLAAFASIEDEGERRRIKSEFRDRFGLPNELLVTNVEQAAAWIIEHVPGVEPVEDEPPAKPKRRTRKRAAAKPKPTPKPTPEPEPEQEQADSIDGPAAALAAASPAAQDEEADRGGD